MPKKIINPANAPKPVGPYNQSVVINNLVYTAGQIPLDPKTMTIVSGDFDAQVKQVFENLKAIATEAQGNFSQIVKLQIFLTDLDYFSAVNEIMAMYFEKPYPARAVVEVSRLPKGAEIEMDAILYLGDA